MPTGDDLVGLGVSAQLAETMGNTPTLLTCAGTTQGAAAKILSKNVELSAAGSATGALLPSDAKVGSPYYLFCSSSTSAVVYVPTGQYINTTQNGTFTLAQNKAAVLFQYKKNYWSSNLTA